MSAFNNLSKIFQEAKAELRAETRLMGKNPYPPMQEKCGVASVNDATIELAANYPKAWDGVVLRLMEYDAEPARLKEDLKAYYRSYERWGLWFALFGCVHISFLPGLYLKAKEYYNS